MNQNPDIDSLIRKDVSAAVKLGVKHHHTGDLEKAESIYKQILVNSPEDANAWHLLGLIAYQREEHDRAIAFIKKALEENNGISGFHYNLGNVYKSQNRLQDAADCFKQSIGHDSKNLHALNNLGSVLKAQGKIEDALETFQNLLALDPDFETAHSNLLLTLNYDSGIDPDRLYHEHQRWSRLHADPLKTRIKTHTNDKDPDRRLRIGYVSPDLRRHSVSYFIEPVLKAHDRSKFEIICYSMVSRPDEVTERLQKLSDRWHDIRKMPNDQVEDLIRKDKIDILVDLTGHMADNRLLLFALKPAPVQITYLGYPNTTGLSTIDYRLTDAWADPYGETDRLYSEKLVRLPNGFLCFQPPENGPEISDLPALKTDMVTFGSFNNIAKVSPETAELWSAILKSVPNSRLILKFRTLTDKTTCLRIKQMFSRQGVSADRIETISHIPSHEGHLALYNDVDIALDPFPYNGTTTTCEALWMGTPVVTLVGNNHASRVGASILSSIEMTELIAETPEQYRHIAVRLSKDRSRLHALRVGLRSKMLHSSLTDAKKFTRSLEKSYRDMWHHWCNHSDITGLSTEPKYRSNPTNIAPMRGTPFNKESNIRPTCDSQSVDTTEAAVRHLIDRVYQKRMNGEGLSPGDLMLMLAHTIMDQSFFQSKYWKFRYGGIRYYPCNVRQSNPGKVLVLQWPGALGDAVMAAHFYTALRHKYPHAQIALLGNRIMQSIYEYSGLIDIFLDNPLDTYLDQVLSGQTIPLRDVLEKIKVLIEHIASKSFDLLLNLQILPMTAVIAKLSYASETLGMTLSDDGMPIIRGNQWYPYLFGTSANLMRAYNGIHRSANFNRLADFYPAIPLEPAAFIGQKSIQTVQQFLDVNGIKDCDVLIGISPMASSPLKAWKQYEELIKALWEKYRAKIILFGSASEHELISTIIERSGVPAIAGTRFDVNELMAAISGCDLFITNDTGPMHLASLVNKKIIALFGPTITREVGPWSEDYVVLLSKICTECFQSTCQTQSDCMGHISIQDVINAVDFYLTDNKDAKDKLSSRIQWCSPVDGKQFSSSLDQAISNKYLRFFESQEPHSIDPGIHQKENGPILEFCNSFKSKINDAVKQLDRDGSPQRLEDMDRKMTASCGFLKTIIVFNDMKYLDKRQTAATNPMAYRLYYLGILKDIEQFLSS